MFGWHAIFLVSGDVRFARLFCGLTELFGGPYSYWVTTRVFLFWVLVIMKQGRGSEATEAVFCLQAKKPLHSGSYEHRVPKIKNQHFSAPGMFV